MLSNFAEDVLKGLSTNPKCLPSKYFYDEKGSKLFEAIMETDEYYLTRKEFEIMEQYGEEFLGHFREKNRPFEIIELGAGSGLKTKLLLNHFLKSGVRFRYIPIDISGSALKELKGSLNKEFPNLDVQPIEGDYFYALSQTQTNKDYRKIVLFMGANIGNFSTDGAEIFLKKINSYLDERDLLVIGFDLWKNPFTIEAAYNDPKGVTRDFNLNLLNRINRELGANFEVENFMHYPTYDIEESAMKSYLVSKKHQTVRIEALNRSFTFCAWEYIHTEVSKKYSLKQIENLAEKTGFSILDHIFDGEKYFANSIWEK